MSTRHTSTCTHKHYIHVGGVKKIIVGIVGKTSFLDAPNESYFVVKLDKIKHPTEALLTVKMKKGFI